MGFGIGTLVFACHLSPYPVVLIGRYTVNSVIVQLLQEFFYFNGYNITSMQVKQHSNAYPQNTSLYSKSLIYIIG